MDNLRVLVVDDSIVFRSQIKSALEGVPGIEVVGVASNGKIALDKMISTRVDLITLDLEMPEMNGLQTLTEMKARGLKAKVIVFSATTQRGADTALEALTHGANDVISKPSGSNTSLEAALKQIQAELIPKIQQFSGHRVVHLPPPVGFTAPAKQTYTRVNMDMLKPEVIVIGSSTGGPNALETVFQNFAKPVTCPILITQHMPPVFTASLAKRLQTASGIPVAEAKQWEILEPGRGYVAPGDFHMSLVKHTDATIRIRLDQGPLRNHVRPAVDILFETAATIYGKKCAAFVLTGMGEDGLVGARSIKSAGGGLMIQDEASCIVFGMPGAIFKAEIFDKVGNLSEVKAVMERMATRK